jgi:hypothetical protein
MIGVLNPATPARRAVRVDPTVALVRMTALQQAARRRSRADSTRNNAAATSTQVDGSGV